jgi:hypothetical protein
VSVRCDKCGREAAVQFIDIPAPDLVFGEPNWRYVIHCAKCGLRIQFRRRHLRDSQARKRRPCPAALRSVRVARAAAAVTVRG